MDAIPYPIILRFEKFVETYTWDHIVRLDGKHFCCLFDDQSPPNGLCERSLTYKNFLLESRWHFGED